MREQHEIDAGGGKRQRMRLGQHVGVAAVARSDDAMGNAARAQQRSVRQTDLHRVVAEYVGNHRIELCFFPPQQVLSLRSRQPVRPIIQTMNTRHSDTHALRIVPLPAFQDNYIWLIQVGNHAAVVDPGDADVVEHHLTEHGLKLTTILVTHHHADHIGGLAALTTRRDIPVYGPAGESIAQLTHRVGDGDEVVLAEQGLRFTVLDVPGHTATHVAYLAPGMLFCGDTLFSAGCGRLLGGTAEQLHASLQRLATLPDDTAVYCTHEYTLANLAFACAAEPTNPERDAWLARCRALRAAGQPTLPSTIGDERRINPFLRTDRPEIIESVARQCGYRPADRLACFAALRAWKDRF